MAKHEVNEFYDWNFKGKTWNLTKNSGAMWYLTQYIFINGVTMSCLPQSNWVAERKNWTFEENDEFIVDKFYVTQKIYVDKVRSESKYAECIFISYAQKNNSHCFLVHDSKIMGIQQDMIKKMHISLKNYFRLSLQKNEFVRDEYLRLLMIKVKTLKMK